MHKQEADDLRDGELSPLAEFRLGAFKTLSL